MEIKLKGYEVLSFEEEEICVKDDDGHVLATCTQRIEQALQILILMN